MNINSKVETNQPETDSEQAVFLMRPLEEADVDVISDWYKRIDDISIFDRQIPTPCNQADVEKLVGDIIKDQDAKRCRWYVAESSDGTPVGMTALESINQLHGNAILPVFIADGWRRSGIGIRMVGMMVDLAFRQLRLHRVATVYRSDNTATDELVDRCGFTREGISRESWFSNGKYYDVINVGILKSEWETCRPRLRAELSPRTIVTFGPDPSPDWMWPDRNAKQQN